MTKFYEVLFLSGRSGQMSARPAPLAPPALLKQNAQTSAHFNRCRIPFFIMKKYTLKTSIKITKPIVFLCGPYIAKNKNEDRRIILRNSLSDICANNVLPLIIDDFLTKENLPDDVNIELLEEIFATISEKTHVFLDTMATAAESGLFMNHMMESNNKISVYAPLINEVYEKGRLGYFIRQVFIGMNGSQIKLVEYHPSIRRVALYSDYVVEHFYFIDDKLPLEILDSIKNDKPQVIYTKLLLNNAANISKNKWEVNYSFENCNNILKIYSSLILLFYVVASVLYKVYSDELTTTSSAKLLDFDIYGITNKVIEAYKSFVLINTGIYNDVSVSLITALNVSTRDVIYHMTAFIFVYHHYAKNYGFHLLKKEEYLVEEIGNHPGEIFGLSSNDFDLLDALMRDNSSFYEKITINKRGKKRDIVTYKDSENGSKLRKLHECINSAINKCYCSNEASFAYQRGKSITMCASAHVKNNHFAKYDINHFFNSIKYERLLRAIENELKIDKRYHYTTGRIVRSFFVDDILPLGLVLSPILSDIYMKDIDQRMLSYSATKGYVYTRYADDIMLSTNSDGFMESINSIEDTLKKSLAKLDLKLNYTKRRIEELDAPGKHIRYIGINIVCGPSRNYMTVGKKYIYDTAKEYLQYLKTKSELSESVDMDDRIKYMKKRLKGRVAYIKQVDGEYGWNKLKQRLRACPECISGNDLLYD